MPAIEDAVLFITVLTVDSNDSTVLVSGEQKHYFHMWTLRPHT
jgi:hypothetical protein